ncbi:hypothetical protein C9374_006391 [Naegleria lovaniensis]|uniref:MRH domain-containing protein n=1 Tax=Naegleria lovaniensis TaxID=51637 RepID=A0AA88GN05_NAELO|nr:uncharacterized protein C9374_006391 [Naegleria lovaniensis]KAG2381402.1 hypothetical protein C9374_006391 [Naegleria lovaniensis]
MLFLNHTSISSLCKTNRNALFTCIIICFVQWCYLSNQYVLSEGETKFSKLIPEEPSSSNNNLFVKYYNNLVNLQNQIEILQTTIPTVRQACYITLPSNPDMIIDVLQAASPVGYYLVQPSSDSTSVTTTQRSVKNIQDSYSTEYYLVQICNPVTNVSSMCGNDLIYQFKAVAYLVDGSSCKPLSNTGGPTVKLLQNSTHTLGISLVYTPFGVNNFLSGTNIDLYCNRYASVNTTQEQLVFKKKITNVLTTTYYFEMYTQYACPFNGTAPETHQD